jgi:glucose/arabinose dehydrogenase
LKLPANFQIAKFGEVENPRMIAVAQDGTVYVTQRMPGALIMFKDTNGDGVADAQKVVVEKKLLHGLAIDGSKMYLISVREVYSADIRPDGMLGELRTIINDLPDSGQHPNRTIAVRGGKLCISVGSTCNACDESNPENATMLVADLNGQNRRIYASGLRNTIGFGWHPVSGKIGYFGPRPPREDPPHSYHFQVFALDTTLNLPSGYNRQALLDAMKGHVIAKGEIVGMYQRRPDERDKQQVLPPKGQ